MRSIPYLCTMQSALEMIREGEHVSQDFKYFLSDTRKDCRTLAAFANSKGGRLLVGVKDNGNIVGLKTPRGRSVRHRGSCPCLLQTQGRLPTSKNGPMKEKPCWRYVFQKARRHPTRRLQKTGNLRITYAKTMKTKSLPNWKLPCSGKSALLSLWLLRWTTATFVCWKCSRHKTVKNKYDIKKLSHLSLMTEKECIDILSGLIAEGILPHPLFTHSDMP